MSSVCCIILSCIVIACSDQLEIFLFHRVCVSLYFVSVSLCRISFSVHHISISLCLVCVSLCRVYFLLYRVRISLCHIYFFLLYHVCVSLCHVCSHCIMLVSRCVMFISYCILFVSLCHCFFLTIMLVAYFEMFFFLTVSRLC